MKFLVLNKTDSNYILGWSKRIKAINLLGGKCKQCGHDDIFALDFHHDSGDKKYSFNKMQGLRWSEIEAEIKKCILLCRNCHQQYHYPETNLYKKKLLEAKKSNGCLRCGYNECLTSLDFHHRDRKTKSFALSYVCRKHGFMFPFERIVNEIEKCDVICRNCHAPEQVNTKKFNRLKKEIYKKIVDYKEKNPHVNKEYAVGLFKSGMKLCDIAKKMNCSDAAISQLLKRKNIKVVRPSQFFEIECQFCKKKFTVRGKCHNLRRKFCSRKCKYMGEKDKFMPKNRVAKLKYIVKPRARNAQ